MDDIDRELLALLLADGRATYQELAKQVRLSANTTAERVRRLRRAGVIDGYHADLDLEALGHSLVMLTDIRLREDVLSEDFKESLARLPQVVAAAHTTGEYDYQLRIACRDAREFERVADQLKRNHGVRESRSRLLLSELPLGPDRLLHHA
ncbi:MAG: AsnC family transcriptional regulator [Streptosporangiales bacterium]|nr:AsnC family transcriptional regulator [Streptosporangiales bacterium]